MEGWYSVPVTLLSVFVNFDLPQSVCLALAAQQVAGLAAIMNVIYYSSFRRADLSWTTQAE